MDRMVAHHGRPRSADVLEMVGGRQAEGAGRAVGAEELVRVPELFLAAHHVRTLEVRREDRGVELFADAGRLARGAEVLLAGLTHPDVALPDAQGLTRQTRDPLDEVAAPVERIAEHGHVPARGGLEHVGELVDEDAIPDAAGAFFVPVERRLHRAGGDLEGLDAEVLDDEGHGDGDGKGFEILAQELDALGHALAVAGQPADRLRIAVVAASAHLRLLSSSSPPPSTARKAFCGISTLPTCFIRALPFFCFSRSLRFRVMSPP